MAERTTPSTRAQRRIRAGGPMEVQVAGKYVRLAHATAIISQAGYVWIDLEAGAGQQPLNVALLGDGNALATFLEGVAGFLKANGCRNLDPDGPQAP